MVAAKRFRRVSRGGWWTAVHEIGRIVPSVRSLAADRGAVRSPAGIDSAGWGSSRAGVLPRETVVSAWYDTAVEKSRGLVLPPVLIAVDGRGAMGHSAQVGDGEPLADQHGEAHARGAITSCWVILRGLWFISRMRRATRAVGRAMKAEASASAWRAGSAGE